MRWSSFFVFLFFSSHKAAHHPAGGELVGMGGGGGWGGGGSRHVAHHLLVVHGLEDVVLPRAVVVAGAGLDEHHVLLHHLPVGTFELHGQGGGPVGGAAAAVQADAAELWPVGLGGGAAGDLELHGLGHTWGTDALFSFLHGGNTDDDQHVCFVFFVGCELILWQSLYIKVEEMEQKNSPGCFAPVGTHMAAPCTNGSVSPGGTPGCRW